MQFDYFYQEESENYAFYRTPKVLCTDKRFQGLSSDAKLLYGILLDRIQLSQKNNWIDEEGHVFVYMTIESIEQALGRCHQKACKVLKELVTFGLVEQKKQGLCKPTKLYVHNFGRVWDSNLQKYETHTHGSMGNIPTEVCDAYANNTEINNTEINKTNPILSYPEGMWIRMRETHIGIIFFHNLIWQFCMSVIPTIGKLWIPSWI